MSYSLSQIEDIIIKADKTLYKIGSIAYEDMFSENSEALDYERDRIFIYKKAVEWGDQYYVGTTKLDKIVERLASKLAIYDYGTLSPLYLDVIVSGNILVAGYVPLTRKLTINGVTQDLSADRVWTIDALPIQTGNAGKYLTTDGTTASWATIDLTGYMLKSVYDTDNNGIVDHAESMVTVCRNSTGSTIYRGTIVYLHGSTGNRPNILKAIATSDATSAQTFGVVEDDIPNNSDGRVVTIGTISNLDTRSTATHPFTNDTLADGDILYLSPTTPGYVTNVKPYAPYHIVYVGMVARTHPTLGTIVYRIQNGYELDELHNVSARFPANGDGIFYNSTTQLWENKSVSAVFNNIYTADGTLTGNRTVNGGGYTLTLNPDLYLYGTIKGSALRTVTYPLGNYTQQASLFADLSFTFDGTSLQTRTGVYSNMVLTNTGVGSNSTSITGIESDVFYSGTATTSRGLIRGAFIQTLRGDATDISTNIANTVYGIYLYRGNASNTTANIYTNQHIGVVDYLQINSGTTNSVSTIWSIPSISTLTSSKASVVNNYYYLYNKLSIGAASGGGGTVTNYYALYIDTPVVGANGTITNRWGLYLTDSVMKHYINGTTLIGSATDTGLAKLQVTGAIQQTSVTSSLLKTDASGVLVAATAGTDYSVLPSQTGNSGKYLTTDGTNASWASVSGTNIYNTDGTLTGNRTVTMGGYNLQYYGTGSHVSLRSTLNTDSSDIIFYSNTYPYGFRIGMYGNSFGSGMNDKASIHMMSKDLYFTQSSSSAPSSADITLAMFQATKNITIGGTTDAGYKLDVQGTGRFTGNLRTDSVLYVGGTSIEMGISSGDRYFKTDLNPLKFFVGTTKYGEFSNQLTWYNKIAISNTTATLGNVAWMKVGLTNAISGTSSGLEFFTIPLANHEPTYLVLGIGDSTYGGGSSVSSVLVYGSKNTTTNAYGNVYLAHDGTSARGNVVVGGFSSNASAIFQIDSTTQGFLSPRMTAAQRTAISTPATGLQTYQTDTTEGQYVNTSAGWKRFLTEADGATRFTQTFTATAGQTVFTSSNTLISGYFDVYVNGVRVNDYSATTSTITLTDACALNDIVDIVGFVSNSVALAQAQNAAITMFNYYNFI